VWAVLDLAEFSLPSWPFSARRYRHISSATACPVFLKPLPCRMFGTLKQMVAIVHGSVHGADALGR
jgi:hypothetical protein